MKNNSTNEAIKSKQKSPESFVRQQSHAHKYTHRNDCSMKLHVTVGRWEGDGGTGGLHQNFQFRSTFIRSVFSPVNDWSSRARCRSFGEYFIRKERPLYGLRGAESGVWALELFLWPLFMNVLYEWQLLKVELKVKFSKGKDAKHKMRYGLSIIEEGH